MTRSSEAVTTDPRVREVLAFWFGNAQADAEVSAEKSAMWFAKDDDVDAAIRARFAPLRELAVKGSLDDWTATPHGALALIVLVDQFSRNLFRDDPRAFAHDAQALAWANELIASGDDLKLRPVERVFAWLPLEHSKSLSDQQRSVEYFSALAREVPDALRKSFDTFRDFAQRHYDMIARFGRFPHRNAVLGRTSTAAESDFLMQPSSSL